MRRSFSTKGGNNDKPPKPVKDEEAKKTRKRAASAKSDDATSNLDAKSSTEAPVKRKRRTKAEIEADKIEAKLKKLEKQGRKSHLSAEPQKMYTLKFNSPILPYAKFPLTQNKYIQDFLRSYEEDKDHISKVIGVHFEKNSNSNA